MDISLDKITGLIAEQGPLFAFMLWVIWNQKTTNEGLREAMQGVQDQRFKAMEDHIGKLERRADECQKDRSMLIEENQKLEVKIAELEVRLDKFRVLYERLSPQVAQ